MRHRTHSYTIWAFAKGSDQTPVTGGIELRGLAEALILKTDDAVHTYEYTVLGAGRQGTAAAYDMAKFGDASRGVLADIDQKLAEKAAERVNNLALIHS